MDLTRFDFNAKRFLNSETVRMMTAEEAGQYILLMAEAWMAGKETTLPDNLAYLARLARVNEVSPNVLLKWPVVDTEHGPRRRNETLYEEWTAAQDRSESARQRVAGRGGKWAGQGENIESGKPVLLIPQNNNSNTTAIPKPNQTKPIQINPDQSNPNTTGSGVRVVDSESKTLGDWKTLAIQHRRLLGGRKAGVDFKQRYFEACEKYGAVIVQTCFEDWAASAREWVERENVNRPLAAFFKRLPELAEEEVEIGGAVSAEEKAEQERSTKAEQERLQSAGIVEQNLNRQKKAAMEFMESGGKSPEQIEQEWQATVALFEEMGYTPEQIEQEKAKLERRV